MNTTYLSPLFIGLLVMAAPEAPDQKRLEFPLSVFSIRLVPCGRILEEPDHFAWACFPVYAPDGAVHVFYSRWPAEAGFEGWKGMDAVVAHAIAQRAEGPYRIVQKSVGLSASLAKYAGKRVWVHNPEIHRVGHQYVMVYNWNLASSHKRTRKIGLALADSLDGPWSIEPNVIQAGPEGAWDHVTVLNPTLLEHPDGRFFLYYRSWDRNHDDQFGVAIAEDVRGPYVKYERNPVIDPTKIVDGKTAGLEDPFAFADNGTIYILCRDFGLLRGRNTPHDEGSGLLFSSDDGLVFSHAPEIAYHGTLHYYEQSEIEPIGPRWRRFEQPKILPARKGKGAYLFTTLGGGEGGNSSGHVFRIAGRGCGASGAAKNPRMSNLECRPSRDPFAASADQGPRKGRR